jgi:hypothetical protein
MLRQRVSRGPTDQRTGSVIRVSDFRSPEHPVGVSRGGVSYADIQLARVAVLITDNYSTNFILIL